MVQCHRRSPLRAAVCEVLRCCFPFLASCAVPWWRLRWPGPCAPSDAARARIDQLLAAPLSIDGATELALLNHRGLQAALAELGIAQAEAVQAAR